MNFVNSGIVAVIVTYNSDPARLLSLLKVLSQQCAVLVVDNSTQDISRNAIRVVCIQGEVSYLPLGDNLGIARAQNLGIAWARDRAVSDILLMDDDSIPPQSFVSDLLKARASCQIQPMVISARTVDVNGQDISNCPVQNLTGLSPCSDLTSPGALIPVVVFDRVGYFDDSLFIDCVDFDWGWRALALGVPLMLCDSVIVQHRLGEGSRLGLKIPNPIRHYYQYRNVLRMIVRSEAPIGWRLSQLIKLPVKLIMIGLVADKKIARLRYAALGVVDFIIGRTGKFNH